MVKVDGFPAYAYLAASPAKARTDAWRSYCSYVVVSFRTFLQISTIRRGGDHPRLGQPIVVGGQPAFWCGFNGQYVMFVRPNAETIFLSHPLDVDEVPA